MKKRNKRFDVKENFRTIEAIYRPIKKLTTMRIDADVLAWLQSFGPGYQTKINIVLRKAMLADRRKEER